MRGRRSTMLLLVAAGLTQPACNDERGVNAPRTQPLDALSPTGVVPDKLWFAITPSVGRETAERLLPMNEFLSQRLKLPVEGKTAKSYDDVARMVNDGEVDMGIMSPATFVAARRKGLNALPIATATRRSSPTYLGYLVARGTEPAPPLGDFRGKRIAWVHPSSTSGYFYPRAMMRQRGLDPDAFFGPSFFADNHHAAIKAVADNKADIAAVGSPFMDPDAELNVPGAKDLVVVAKTRRIPLDCVVIHKRIQRDLAKSIQQALIALSHDPKTSRDLAESWGLSGFVLPMRQRYEEIDDVLDKAQ